jgi:two-component system, cell cycle response regulator CtrA
MRILLVEDDPTTSRSIELMLTHANLNVYCTDMGEDGVDLAKLYDYDLILLDLNLPDMSGHEVLRQVRQPNPSTARNWWRASMRSSGALKDTANR